MEIKTKFNVHDLLVHKYDMDKINSVIALEVLQIKTESCYAGTQVFYDCRAIIANKSSKDDRWHIGHSVILSEDNKTGWKKYREDELLPASKETINLLKRPDNFIEP